MFEDYKDVVTFQEMCEMLNLGRNKAYKLLENKEIKAKRANGDTGKYIIPKKNVIFYIENN